MKRVTMTAANPGLNIARGRPTITESGHTSGSRNSGYDTTTPRITNHVTFLF